MISFWDTESQWVEIAEEDQVQNNNSNIRADHIADKLVENYKEGIGKQLLNRY